MTRQWQSSANDRSKKGKYSTPRNAKVNEAHDIFKVVVVDKLIIPQSVLAGHTKTRVIKRDKKEREDFLNG